MKSEFILAFNEICESRGLPKEDVFEALKTALVSAYRRDANLSNNQRVRVEIDPRTGEPTIYSEKEVVEDIFDNRTEVLIEDARREGYVDVELGDLVMVDSTTESFGRIAAQTAKQVLLQRVREAEREHLFEDFSGREGELVNGTVQSISGLNITIGLGRTEAVLPKNQQVPSERYRPHDKIRVYVLEVRRSARGPQIVVSRNHRNLLRRLLELEVPEIYNGQVEIKSIAREAGQRSKVAVQALQHGVDPVGACVGMRGVRIQSIVRELNDEKIDVIEWDSDQRVFIAKALSPARVSHVFLEEHPEEGKTAIVIVPDDQLSLAIGREGQNARLAAKLTGWRIDIKSLTEAAGDALNNIDHPAADPRVAKDPAFLAQVQQVLDKKAAGRPITAEDYLTLDRLVAGIEGKIVAERAQNYESVRRQRVEMRRRVPDAAFQQPLDVLDLPGRIHNLLLDASVETVGDLMYVLEMGDEYFLKLRGLGDVALETVKETLANYQLPEPVEEEVAEVAEGAPVEAEAAAVVEDVTEEVIDETIEEALEMGETAVVTEEDVMEAEELPIDIDIAEFAQIAAAEEAAAAAAAAAAAVEPALPIDDLSKPLVEIKAEPAAPKKEKKPTVVIVRPATPVAEEKPEDAGKKKKKKPRRLGDDPEDTTKLPKGGGRKEDWVDDIDLERF
jgi:N utilization substance protein A